MIDNPVTEVEDVFKSFGPTQALAGVSLLAEPGRVLALLGPNGAGKTTLVRILTTLLAPDQGRAAVAGYDTVRRAAAVRAVIGLTGQYAAADELLTGRENLRMLGQLNHLGRAEARRRADESLGGAIHTPGPNYADYLLPTIMILAMLLGATTAVAFATDLAGGMIDRFRSLPIARAAVLAGRTSADLARTALVLAVSLVVGVAVGFRFHNGFWLGLAGLGLLLAVFGALAVREYRQA